MQKLRTYFADVKNVNMPSITSMTFFSYIKKYLVRRAIFGHST
jgi:hypothetical protein